MRKRTRLLLVLLTGLVGGGIAIAGALPEGVASVSDVAAHPEHYTGREVHVKAMVAHDSIDRSATASFAITDTLATLPVEYRGSLPEQFAGGRTVVVSGVVEQRAAGPVLVASSIQGGCASKYEPAPPQGSA